MLRGRIGDHALAGGVQYRHEHIHDEKRDADGKRVGPAPLTDDSFSDFGLVLQDEWAANDRLDLVLGVRVDDASTVDGLVVSPRVASAWALRPNWKLRAAFSTGFRAPDVFSEDLHVDTLGGVPVPVANAPGLSEERSHTVQIGFARVATPGEATPWGWDATLSHTKIEDTFVLTRTGAGAAAVDLRENGAGSSVTGLEANINVRPARSLRLDAGLAYYVSRHDEAETVLDDGAGTVLTTRDHLKTPRLSALAQAVWSPLDGHDLFAAVKFTGPMDVLNNRTKTINHSEEFYVVDLGYTRHIDLPNGRHLDWSIGVKNVFDQRQRDLESGATRDSDYVYGPRFARSFYTQLRHEF